MCEPGDFRQMPKAGETAPARRSCPDLQAHEPADADAHQPEHLGNRDDEHPGDEQDARIHLLFRRCEDAAHREGIERREEVEDLEPLFCVELPQFQDVLAFVHVIPRHSLRNEHASFLFASGHNSDRAACLNRAPGQNPTGSSRSMR